MRRADVECLTEETSEEEAEAEERRCCGLATAVGIRVESRDERDDA